MTAPRAFAPPGAAVVFWRQANPAAIVLTRSQPWRLSAPLMAQAIMWRREPVSAGGGAGITGPLISRSRLTHSPLIAGRIVQ